MIHIFSTHGTGRDQPATQGSRRGPRGPKKKTPGEDRVQDNWKADKAKSKEADVNKVINHAREKVNTKLK